MLVRTEQAPATGLPDRERVTVTLRPVAVRRFLIVVVLTLVALHMAFVIPGHRNAEIVDLDYESSLGTWLIAVIFTAAGLLSVLLGAPHRKDLRSFAFTGFGVVLMLFGIEEVWALHEPTSQRVAMTAVNSDSHSAGTPLMGLAMLPFAVVGMVWLWRTSVSKATALFVGTAIWYVSAFGVEQLEAWNGDEHFASLGSERTVHDVLNGIQEGGELLGAAILFSGLLAELAGRGTAIVVRAGPVEQHSSDVDAVA